jgi:hypothetical protein
VAEDADSFEALTRHYLLAKQFPPSSGQPRPADRALARWRGIGVTIKNRSDGWITANCLGLTGIGPTEGDALLDLERRLGINSTRI